MRMLAIETATEACSVALFEDGALLDSRHEILGRGHAERLVPMIAELPDKGRAEDIRVSLGPGSFTGVRIGLAVARALGIAWRAQVRGYPTLALVAAMARGSDAVPVTVCMTGGHGEWFVQDFGSDGRPVDDVASLAPELASARELPGVLAGSKAEELATRKRVAPSAIRLPEARYVLNLPPDILSESLTPLYGRPPDAKLPSR
ncbi:MAG: tRNA (adenosine(37)-N6)-threonylcarbamoyltransferase complex dimerization subunit type 1 TsaB [Erythrobacter sp.]|uniref:tRNA (adenosine(37)-N6)-threonylcarbamoyltransferase complex dimerization subunit type 1 TsaB n=1 Tax=Erythrobacter sp. TaxID=1042 RepID=UPI001B046EDB|nr:tRNA (adenosine(37)-N6)-threonylcarbamoyltransferase complex dimerization subunit type 1 TsaB [Erythrobacter sp.]MBO6768140.1 tRNA (adenosine(37)-N6)-threonylcarbamoyltransferase complex dimerization subunit type 1 TsaB [Erythrobacter sp.]